MSGRCGVVFVGVGGQGVLHAARLLGETAHRLGIPVTVAQLHDMSQRGGAVQAAVLTGSNAVIAVEPGSVDVLIALEAIEALRALRLVGPGTTVLCSTRMHPPASSNRGGPTVPSLDEIASALAQSAAAVHLLDAPSLALQAGAAGTNLVMLGALAALAAPPVPAAELLATIRAQGHGPADPRTSANQAAFTLGLAGLSAASRIVDPRVSQAAT